MGLLGWVHRRTEEKLDAARKSAYEKAIADGASEEDAAAAGERAAVHKRRVRRSLMSGGHG